MVYRGLDFGFRVSGFWIRVQGLGILELGFGVQGSWI